jgi:hypothetical protein
LLTSGKLTDDLGLPAIDRATDRFMLCGSPAMLCDLRTILEARGLEEGNHGAPGDFVIEKAFVEKRTAAARSVTARVRLGRHSENKALCEARARRARPRCASEGSRSGDLAQRAQRTRRKRGGVYLPDWPQYEFRPSSRPDG